MTAPPDAEAFRLSDVTVRAPGEVGRPVLERFSLLGLRGSATALVGHVGGGKTTALKLLAGLVAPSAGEVRVLGEEPHSLSYEGARAYRRRVGYAFESTGLIGNMTLGENIGLALAYEDERHDTAQLIADKVKDIAEELRIERHLSEMPFRANGSVKKRALLARALVREPELLLCDEPQVGLTPKEARLVSNAIERRRLRGGLTVVFADHDGHLDPFVVLRVVYLENGRLLLSPSLRPPTDRQAVPPGARISLSTDLIYRGSS
jgi:ABC-type transporter Mla maintaining outer membrane lipid asymmetry ATPase subunit MlaF